jgi:acyl dehydratase
VDTHYLDDLHPGQVFVSPGVTLSEAEIVGFALRYDPQPFHLDAAAAAESLYGGLIASGFQTLALSFRMFIQTGVFADSSMGSPGMDELRWLAPVRPGDTLHTKVEVIAVKASNSKPDRGIARLQYWTINQHGDVVASFVINHLLRREIDPASA